MHLTVSFADRVHRAVQKVSPRALEAGTGLGCRPATRRVTTGLRWGWRSRTWPAPPAPARLAHVVRRQPVRSGPLGLLASGASAAAPGASEHVGTRAGDRRLGTGRWGCKDAGDQRTDYPLASSLGLTNRRSGRCHQGLCRSQAQASDSAPSGVSHCSVSGSRQLGEHHPGREMGVYLQGCNEAPGAAAGLGQEYSDPGEGAVKPWKPQQGLMVAFRTTCPWKNSTIKGCLGSPKETTFMQLQTLSKFINELAYFLQARCLSAQISDLGTYMAIYFLVLRR